MIAAKRNDTGHRTGGRRILLGNGYLKTSAAGTWAGRATRGAYSDSGVIGSPSIRLPIYGEQAVTFHRLVSKGRVERSNLISAHKFSRRPQHNCCLSIACKAVRRSRFKKLGHALADRLSLLRNGGFAPRSRKDVSRRPWGNLMETDRRHQGQSHPFHIVERRRACRWSGRSSSPRASISNRYRALPQRLPSVIAGYAQMASNAFSSAWLALSWSRLLPPMSWTALINSAYAVLCASINARSSMDGSWSRLGSSAARAAAVTVDATTALLE